MHYDGKAMGRSYAHKSKEKTSLVSKAKTPPGGHLQETFAKAIVLSYVSSLTPWPQAIVILSPMS